MPHSPSCLTCLTCLCVLRAFVPFPPSDLTWLTYAPYLRVLRVLFMCLNPFVPNAPFLCPENIRKPFVITFDTEILTLLTLEGCHGWNKIGAGSGLENFWKGSFSGLRQFLTTASPLKMMKNVFYFMLKVLFVLGTFKFLSWFFGYVEKTAW